MHLKYFVSESIVQVLEGIVNVQKRLSSVDARVIPDLKLVSYKSQSGRMNLAIGWDKNGNSVHSVESKYGASVVAQVFVTRL